MVKDRKVSQKAQGNELMDQKEHIKVYNSKAIEVPRFNDKLNSFDGFKLTSKEPEILQINLGYMCNQVCEHCHVDAGPDRKEIMSKETLEACLKAIDNSSINTVDLTGGAPEMNPNFVWFVEECSKREVKIIVRSNLTILVSNKKYEGYPEFFKEHKVEVIASLPCYTKENTDKQRGEGVFSDSINALLLLNEVGYGIEGSGLDLNLVFNPGGPAVAPSQEALEGDYKKVLKDEFNVSFNNLYTITNVPVSRFLDYLLAIGRYEEYMNKLHDAFNIEAAKNVMCTNTLSVRWDGKLYDCDFNQMLDLPVRSSNSNTIYDFTLKNSSGREIIVNQHCYACTAGSGSSCQGALV